jgi:hypothetical protein
VVKKIANSILVFVLLVTTTGMTCHYHYCGHTLVSYSLLHTPKPCCEHPDDCCSDKAVTFQFKSDYCSTVQASDFSIPSVDLPVPTFQIKNIQPAETIQTVIPEESPPPKIILKLAMLHQYLFYH